MCVCVLYLFSIVMICLEHGTFQLNKVYDIDSVR